MSPRSVTNFCAIPAALFLLLIGILHSIVNVSGLRRALARGEIAARFGEPVLLNAAFSGLLMSLLGLLVLLVLPGLRTGSRQAGRVVTAIGIFVSILGVAGFLRVPTKPSVLIFLFFGTLLARSNSDLAACFLKSVKGTLFQQGHLQVGRALMIDKSLDRSAGSLFLLFDMISRNRFEEYCLWRPTLHSPSFRAAS